METESRTPTIRPTERGLIANIAVRASSILNPIANGILVRRAILSTIIGKAVSIGKIRTMMDMMTEITAFGMKGNFDTSFSFSDYQFKI